MKCSGRLLSFTIIFLSMLFFTPIRVYTQSLYIEIWDSITFRSIQDVLIEIESNTLRRSYYSSPIGSFQMDLPAGDYIISFSHEMFFPEKQQITIPENNRILLSVKLKSRDRSIEYLSVYKSKEENLIEIYDESDLKSIPDFDSPASEFKVVKVDDNQHQEIQQEVNHTISIIEPVSPIQNTNTQQPETDHTFRYRRSSLHLVMIETGSFPKKDIVVNAYQKMPFPDKYNDHSIPFQSFNPNEYARSESERNAFKQNDESIISSDIPRVINNYITQNKIGNHLVAHWFNRQPNGTFNMDVVHDRGHYNASEMEASIARGQVRGVASLQDAGKELIANTFIIFSMLNFVDNEPVARIARDLALREARKLRSDALEILNKEKENALREARSQQNPIFRELAISGVNRLNDQAIKLAHKGYEQAESVAEAAYRRAAEGYSVWTTSWLYQLEWNENIAETFYTKYWMDKNSPCPEKKMLFDQSSDFILKLIGSERSVSLVTFSLSQGPRSESQIIELSTIRNIDATLAKLQRNYDVFKPVVPLVSVNPIMAQIGMKEGLSGRERFEILEPFINHSNGILEYKKVGTIRADRNKVWDNRYYAGERSGQEGNGTLFTGSARRLQPGMLIRQIR